MSLYGSNLRIDLITLQELAGLEAGNKNSPHYLPCLMAVCNEFPSGDVRLVGWAEPHAASLIANSSALKYWDAKYPKHPAPARIAEPVTTEGWQKLVEGLKADNDRLRVVTEAANKLPENVEDKQLTNCDKVTFGAVCFLLAQFGIVDRVSKGRKGEVRGTVISEKLFQTPGLSPPTPVPSSISKAIGDLATEKTNVNYPDAGFVDSGRRKSISDAIAAFSSQIIKNKINKH